MHEVIAKGILSANNGMNIYRGCTHGCIYCDSRSNCYQMHHDFEDIEVKANAPELLEKALRSKRNKCMIGTGAMTDPYIHLEEKLGNTRRCLEIIERYGFGLAIQTKSARILRDLDLLNAIHQKSKCVVSMTLTTYQENLCRILEPNVSTTKERFEVLKVLRDDGIPTVVWLTPILPFINDTVENLKGIMDYCIKAKVYGVLTFGLGMTLREGNREYFYQKLDAHFPGLKESYIQKYGTSYGISSPANSQLMECFWQICRENHIQTGTRRLFAYMQEYQDKTYQQMKFEF